MAFWLLHLDLIHISKNINNIQTVDRQLALKLLTLQQKILNLVSAHFNEKDIFNITNLNDDMLYDFIERFEMAILGAVNGVVLDESNFDLVNPYIHLN